MKSPLLPVASLVFVLLSCRSDEPSQEDDASRYLLEPGSRSSSPSVEVPAFVDPVAAPAASPEPEPASEPEAAVAPPPPDSPPGAPAARSPTLAEDVPGTPAEVEAPRPTGRTASVDDSASALPRPQSLGEVETRARAAFQKLSEKDRREVFAWLAVELEKLPTFQASLIEYVLTSPAFDAESVPREARPEYAQVQWYDPELHAPAQPIPRALLRPDDRKTRSLRKQVLGAIAPRHAVSGWQYDYAKREIVRLPDWDDSTRIFENALIGLPPDWDFVEALVERALDDGSLQKTFAAFAHPYTDRDGGVYPGVTLYDAWASNTEFETPDVDCLGIIHELLGDWDTWKSVVPDTQHESLYGKIGDIFRDAHRYRGLRHNLARSYLCGTTELRDGYQYNLDRFHALWEKASSDPARLAGMLPEAPRSFEFLQSWVDELFADELAMMKGYRRHCTLDDDGRRVRTALLWVLDQFGAYEGLESTRASSKSAGDLEQG